MKQSIEAIWKQGFLSGDALVAPKVNDLYGRKSEHVIERFKRMFRVNLKGLWLGAVLGVIGFALLRMPIVGAGLAVVLVVIALVNRRLLRGLEAIDQSRSSYQYLKAFEAWMSMQMALNARMAKFYYPTIFLSCAFGLWFSPHGPVVFEALFGEAGSAVVWNGVPAFILVPLVGVAVALWFVGDRIYRWDLNVVYGRVLKKLDELIADIEELRGEAE